MEIVIRIDGGDAGTLDWSVAPEKVTFQDTMHLISKSLFPQGPTVTAFEYLDEDGDRITVRSDEEMAELVRVHIRDMHHGGSEHLLIYPKVGRSRGKMNIDGLKVHTTTPGRESTEVIPIDSGGRSSRTQQSQDISEILAGGTPIDESDLIIQELLGVGSTGKVYKAHHKNTGVDMAVKMIKLELTPDSAAGTQKQIMSELQVLYKCRSPVIIAFYGAYFVENQISICTEYMDGGSLDKYKRIDEQVLGRMTVAVVSGLHYLWTLKIMHRDVKPVNLLVNTRGQVKLCDFSISVQLATTMAKTMIGTHAYMAPERILGQDYSVYSDVWSLGVTLFELAIGRFPYESAIQQTMLQKTRSLEEEVPVTLPLVASEHEARKLAESSEPMALLNSIVYGDPPQLPTNAVSDVFGDFIHQCMQKEPKMRPLPEALTRHPLISMYNDGNLEIVAHWVCAKLEQMKSRAQQGASSFSSGHCY